MRNSPEALEINRLKHLGTKHSEETKKKIGLARLGKIAEQATAFKGDNIGYTALHHWVRNHLPKPDICPCCEEKPSYDLANYTGIYDRNFDNWVYLCRSCHMKLDYKMGVRLPS